MNHSVWKRILPTAVAGLLMCAAGLFWPESELQRPLMVAVNIWPGVEGLLAASESKLAEDKSIHLVEMSWSTAAMGAFRKRVVDAAIVTLDEVLRLEEDGAEPRVVLILGIPKGSDAILGVPGIKSVQELKGKRVGVELRSTGEYLLTQALAAAGMTQRDIRVVPLNLAETEAAYIEREVDAVVTADPWRIRLQDKGAEVLFDSSTMGLELSRVLVVRADALKKFPRQVQALVSAHFDYLAKMGGENDEERLDAILRREDLSRPQWQQALALIHAPDAAENRRLMEPGPDGLAACMEKMSAMMLREQLLQHEVKTQQLLTPEFLQEDR